MTHDLRGTGVPGDLSVMKPTVLAGVPAMMDRIQKAVWERVHSSPNELFKALFLWAYRHKRRRFRRGLDTPIINWLFFRKVRRILGGEVHTILSGGAPLSQDSLEFITVCMCCYVGQGTPSVRYASCFYLQIQYCISAYYIEEFLLMPSYCGTRLPVYEYSYINRVQIYSSVAVS